MCPITRFAIALISGAGVAHRHAQAGLRDHRQVVHVVADRDDLLRLDAVPPGDVHDAFPLVHGRVEDLQHLDAAPAGRRSACTMIRSPNFSVQLLVDPRHLVRRGDDADADRVLVRVARASRGTRCTFADVTSIQCVVSRVERDRRR